MEQSSSTIEQLMTTGVLTAPAETGVREAAERLVAEGVGSLVVVDETGRPMGLFTNTDLAAFVAEGAATDATVGEYATEEMITVATGSSIREAAARMIRQGVHHLPVTDEEGEVVGMLSTMDLAAHFSYTGGTDMI
jgi:CBS domain-containing protein